MSFSTGNDALEALAALGRKLETRGTESISLLICGGSALNISGLLSRATEDVDVLAGTNANKPWREMPNWLFECAEEVAKDLHLEARWLNDAAASVAGMGLPAGILSRATKRSCGKLLEISTASRMDLIALKCFAALDPKVGAKHLGDLVDLNPKPEEMSFACDWLLDRPTSAEFRAAVRQLCDVLGHSDLARE